MSRARCTRVGRVYRDVERQLAQVPRAQLAILTELMARVKRILTQQTKNENRLYALHAPEVECITEGKAKKCRMNLREGVDRDNLEGRTDGRIFYRQVTAAFLLDPKHRLRIKSVNSFLSFFGAFRISVIFIFFEQIKRMLAVVY